MCSPAICPACRKVTYAGCGNHVEQVLGDLPRAERCQCGQGSSPGRARRGWRSALTGR